MRKSKSIENTNPANYTFYDRKNNICWVMQPSQEELNDKNTGLTNESLNYIKEKLNKWQDGDIKKFIADDSKLGDFFVDETLMGGFGDRSLAIAVKPNCTKAQIHDFMFSPCRYLFDYKDNLCDDVEIMGAMVFSRTMTDNCNIDYNVVNKKYRGKGLGTAMVKSFTDNIEAFTDNNYNVNVVHSTIRDDNESSIKCMLKNGFRVVPGSHRLFGIKHGKQYHLYKKVLTNDNVMEMER